MGADHDSDEHGEEGDGGEDPSWECPSSSVPAAVEGRERGREHVSSLEAYARRARSRVTSQTTVDANLKHRRRKALDVKSVGPAVLSIGENLASGGHTLDDPNLDGNLPRNRTAVDLFL